MNRFAGLRWASLIVLAGSAGGLGVNLCLTPVISRIYTPETFGTFATIAAVSSIFVGISTFRLEVRSQQVVDAAEANGLIRLGLITASVWALAISLVSAAAVLVFDINAWWITCGPLVVVASLQLLGVAVLTRRRNYKTLSLANFAHGVSLGVGQVLFGLLSSQVWALLAGFASARLVWLTVLQRFRKPRIRAARLWGSSRRFALISGGSALINSCAGQLPLLLCSWLYGSPAAGFLAMAVRLLTAPLALVAEAAGAANVGEVGKMIRDHDPAAKATVRIGMRDLLVIGAIPCVIAAALGSWLVPQVLGSTWSQSGDILAILTVGAYAQFVVAPLSQLLNIMPFGHWLLRWDIARFILIAASFGVPAFMGGTVIMAVSLYSVAMLALYTCMAILVVVAIGRNDGES